MLHCFRNDDGLPVGWSVRWVAIAALLMGCWISEPRSQGDDGIEVASQRLAEGLSPWLDAYQLKKKQFTLHAKGSIPIDNNPQGIEIKLARHSDAAFDLVLEHPEYAVTLIRRKDMTVLALPKHRKLFWGAGEVDPKDHLDSAQFGKRVVRATTEIAGPVGMLNILDSNAIAELLVSTNQLIPTDSPLEWNAAGETKVSWGSGATSNAVSVSRGGLSMSLALTDGAEDRYGVRAEETADRWVARHWSDFEAEELSRVELEQTIVRGLRRALEVLVPSSALTQPKERSRTVEHGELRWIEGQRVVLLSGTPEQIGQAHGELLRSEATRCIDSVLHGFGLAQTIANGRWFKQDLERAYSHLRPHIPERHIAETRALARAIGMDEQTVEILNVFPELFHCSGFAVFGSATEGGKLYHGRVLDYMTAIGLQDAATTFIVSAEGQIPFANVGYAGFTGSVSGMNAEKISLGEMGGKGEGQWNGVPMATLMRRALEECDSLDEVKSLWSESPRTCEYYYVFADGETKTAVGVAATPEKIEFVAPGESHTMLGEGIADTVVLSAGSRLDELRRRIASEHGTIDADKATQLMCRPVAMTSNLHNVLFVPEDGELRVANASHTQPAAERPYVRLSLVELLKEWRTKQLGNDQQTQANRFKSQDKLDIASIRDSSDDAKQCLEGLCWRVQDFNVEIEPVAESNRRFGYDRVVRFPSPLNTGDPVNDLVAMEWYRASKDGLDLAEAPAIVVVHESGRGMTVGRLVARGLSKQGVHALMLQLPSYGLRRNPANQRSQGEILIQGLRQGIADARRAHDAVRVLPGIDPERVSIQGTSLGGFVVATTSGLDNAYYRSMILLAGGDLFSVLSKGDRDAAKTRQELERSGITMEQVKQALYAIEPLRLAHRVAASRTWLFSGTHDTVVPPACSKAFANAAMLPEGHHVELPADHYSGVVFLPGVIQQMAAIASEPTSTDR